MAGIKNEANKMKIWEPHIHLYARTTDDYKKMALAGIRTVCEPAFWMGQPRKHAGTFFDYFEHMCHYETERAASFDIDHYTLLAMNPKEANNAALAQEVLDALPAFLSHPRVVGVGEIGFDDMTQAEEDVMRRQIEIAIQADLPIMVHLPHRNKLEGTRRTIAIFKEMEIEPERVLLDHNTEETIELTLEAGYWAGHTVYPVTKLTPDRAADIFKKYGVEKMMVNSSADWGPSDPLSVPHTIQAMEERGITQEAIETLVWRNPETFYAQSGKIDA